MKLERLYIKDFMCHEISFIDFNIFSSALVVGKVGNNDSYSNGVGKSTIFYGIEYCLFNEVDFPLEDVIRDDSQECSVTLDFSIDKDLYRVTRIRTKKGSSDLSLYKNISASEFHDAESNPKMIKAEWKNLSSSRNTDTEKTLEKLIKINYKSFRNTTHFVQNDVTGLTTSTPEKRKALLKDTLNLSVYQKLEKISKEESSKMAKDIAVLKSKIKEGEYFTNSKIDLEFRKQVCDKEISNVLSSIDLQTAKCNLADAQLKEYEALTISKTVDLVNNKSNAASLKTSIEKAKASLNNLLAKKAEILEESKKLAPKLLSMREAKTELESKDLEKLLETEQENLAEINSGIDANQRSLMSMMEKLNELKIPLPKDKVCNSCRQTLSDEHRAECQLKITDDIKTIEQSISKLKNLIASDSSKRKSKEQEIKEIKLNIAKMIELANNIVYLADKMDNNKTIFAQYNSLINNENASIQELEVRYNELLNLIESDNSKIYLVKKHEAEAIVKEEQRALFELNKVLFHNKSLKENIETMIISLDSEKNENDKNILNLKNIEDEFKITNLVIEAFSSTGIPNLIIQNLLDDLQTKANEFLVLLKPSIQLVFVTEKENSKKVEEDTLDIDYFVNGKKRRYSQLSGAMKLAVFFSLKLSLSAILQSINGTEIKFLLLDEIDQSLDKASVDAFADIVKSLQKDFNILVITHNDRLKDKFQYAVLVKQDLHGVSKAKVVESW